MKRALITIAILLACGSQADGGYVFLKNGYILQGKITDRSEAQVILDYPGGQVTVERRYIKHVVLDPSEEALERARKELVERGESSPPRDLVERDHVLDLPASIEEVIPGHRPFNGDHVVDANPDLVTPTPSPQVTDVQQVEPAAPPLPAVQREVAYPEVGVALRAPLGWTATERDGLVELRQPGREFPNLKIQRYRGGGVDLEAAAGVLRDTLTSGYEGVRILSEDWRQVGLRRARVLTGEYPSRNLMFTQVLVLDEDEMYLLGAQSAAPTDPDQQRELERCLFSMRFLP